MDKDCNNGVGEQNHHCLQEIRFPEADTFNAHYHLIQHSLHFIQVLQTIKNNPELSNLSFNRKTSYHS